MNVERQGWGAVTEGLGSPIRKLLEQRSGMVTCVTLSNGQQILVHDVAWGRDAGDMWEHVITNCSPPVAGRDVHFFILSDVASVSDPETGKVLMEQEPRPDER